MLVHHMSGFKHVNTIDDVTKFLVNSKSVNEPLLFDFSSDRVNNYCDIVKICRGLVQQRQFLSRDNSVFKFLKEDQI